MPITRNSAKNNLWSTPDNSKTNKNVPPSIKGKNRSFSASPNIHKTTNSSQHKNLAKVSTPQSTLNQNSQKVLHTSPGPLALVGNLSLGDHNPHRQSLTFEDPNLKIPHSSTTLESSDTNSNTMDPSSALSTSRDDHAVNRDEPPINPDTQLQDLARALPLGTVAENPSNFPVGPNLENTQLGNSNNSITLDALIHMFQQGLRNTQEELRKEVESIKASIGNGSSDNTQINNNQTVVTPNLNPVYSSTSGNIPASAVHSNINPIYSFPTANNTTLDSNLNYNLPINHSRTQTTIPGPNSINELADNINATRGVPYNSFLNNNFPIQGNQSFPGPYRVINPNIPTNYNTPLIASNSTTSFDTSVRVKEWKISYDGTSPVSDFLFKIETLCERTNCSYDQLMASFHVLLSGKAENWFWLFTKQNRNASYPELKFALTKEFGSLESDHDIILKISSRKQTLKESYDDFHSSVITMNSRLTDPMAERSLIEIMKRNVNANLKVLLFNSQPRTLNDLRDMARKGEEVLRESKLHLVYSSAKQVNELHREEDDVSDNEIDDPQVEALQLPKRYSKPDYSKIQCWNCSDYGHSYIYCMDEARNVFCYKCGLKGVLTPNCPNKHQGNLRNREMSTGSSRANYQKPGQN